MAIITQKDTLKIQISKKGGIALLFFSGLTLLTIIISNIYWLSNYDINSVAKDVAAAGKKITTDNLNAYVRMKAIFTIVGNTLIIGLFSGVVWWSISKKRLGLGFGIFWIIVFGGNAISTPFYSVQVDAFSIISLLLHVSLAIIILIWLSSVIAYRQRLRQEIARRRGI